MNEPSEEVKAMARRIADAAVENHGAAKGTHTWEIAREAAIAAILETQRRDAELAAWAHMVPPDGGSPTPEECALAETIATAIRTGNHYGKAEQ
ncbi:MAG: hypothetical protein IE934_08875 [Sphingopyxis sp.]|nr:hypothetical protein [Sphingopyxis sp.]